MDVVIGIDLGTTNSEVTAFIDNTVKVLSVDEALLLPSVVGFDLQDNLLIGQPARSQCVAFPERTVRSVKRKMGTTGKIQLGDQCFSPAEVSAIILKKLKQTAEQHLETEVTQAVITVPAYFNDAQRQATRDAGNIAGLDVLRILNEPTAAALAYHPQEDRDRIVMVYDLGGGTFDVSIVRQQLNVTEVLSSYGNNHLGGDDFDIMLCDFLIKRLNLSSVDRVKKDLKVFQRILRAAEECKIALSSEKEVRVVEENLFEKKGILKHLDVVVTRGEFEDLIDRYVQETLHCIHKACNEARMSYEDIDEVILVGGSTWIPYISEKISEVTGKIPNRGVHPELCVAMGAGMMASRLAGHDIEKVLVDITPYSFGVAVLSPREGVLYPHCYNEIIGKGTSLPAESLKTYYTVYDDQDRWSVRVYQGEEEDALRNTLVGEFLFDISPQPENSPINCHMALDVNGILHVTIRDPYGDSRKYVKIEGAAGAMDRFKVLESRVRLEELFGENLQIDDVDSSDGREVDGEHRFAPEERYANLEVQARQLLAKSGTRMESLASGDKEELIELVAELTDQFATKNVNALQCAISELDDFWYYLESAGE